MRWDDIAIDDDLAGMCVAGDNVDAPPSCEERIAFETDRDGIRQVYTMRADGSDVSGLTMTSNDEVFASGTGDPVVWSPRGDRLAYVKPEEAFL